MVTTTFSLAQDLRKLDPFFVGVDRMWKHMDDLNSMVNNGQNYPPYNILKDDDESYTIEMAVAGFTEEDISVVLKDSKLTVEGNVEDKDGKTHLHKGIANRSFKRDFTLADTIEVEGADLANGMLKITLKNIIPDHKKPKTIPVTTGGKLIEKAKQLLTE